ncbi:muscarinic acetylcholine receptor M2-like [Ptychodera flava]|uniref:muscarinic acetylcholine receptor M2-like n=1 Tax=Ptychodera flava TaxID=63121 RepID=UPI00396A1466
MARKVLTRKKINSGDNSLDTDLQVMQCHDRNAVPATISRKFESSSGRKFMPSGNRQSPPSVTRRLNFKQNYSIVDSDSGQRDKDNGKISGDVVKLESVRLSLSEGCGNNSNRDYFRDENQMFSGLDVASLSFLSSEQTKSADLGCPNDASEIGIHEHANEEAGLKLDVTFDNPVFLTTTDDGSRISSSSKAMTLNEEHKEDFRRTTENYCFIRTAKVIESVIKSDNDKVVARNPKPCALAAKDSTTICQATGHISTSDEKNDEQKQRKENRTREAVEKNSAIKSNDDKKTHRTENKAFVTVTTIVMALIVCTVPYQALVLLKNVCPSCLLEKKMLQYIDYTVFFAYYINNAIDPICYAYTNPKFRRSLGRLVRRCKL